VILLRAVSDKTTGHADAIGLEFHDDRSQLNHVGILGNITKGVNMLPSIYLNRCEDTIVLRTTRNKAFVLVISCLFTMTVACAAKKAPIVSSNDYQGDKTSFAAFINKHGKANWPEPKTIAYFDPEGTNAQIIRYAHWEPPAGKKTGVVVHFNGRTEFIEKNIYTYKDLIDRGFAVWALDWRGQGFSKRQIEEKQKHSIDSFDTYVKDAAYFIDNVTDTRNSNGKKVLLAHSMGGQIALRYLLEHPDTFDCAVLSSPLLGLPGDAWYIKAGNWIKRNTFFADSCVVSKPPLWTHNFAGDDPCSYVNKKIFSDDDLDKDQNTKNYSHDLNKVAEIDCLIGSSIDAKGTKNTDLRVACPTTRWLYEAYKSTSKVMKEAKSISTPVLIVRAKNDQAVDTEAQDDFCDLTDTCELITIPEDGKPETGHELLVETEEIRKKFFEHFDKFVGK
jgi:lysophospholipase